MTARATAIARREDEIAASQERAIAARSSKPRTALEAMATRLEVPPEGLKRTLMQTAFKGCNDEQFVSLVIVANEYQLNPLLKEIYAFPGRGGSITPMVGYDGWVKIMNRHPEFDGIEFDHIEDKQGNIKAVECVIYRKDRTRPIKKIVHLSEFKRPTDPWKNSPAHMLDVRALCQTVRLAFGVSAEVEGEYDPEPIEVRSQSLPSAQTTAEYLDDSIPSLDHDEATGEVIKHTPRTGMTEVDEETARRLDAGEDPALASDSGEEDTANDGRGAAQAGGADQSEAQDQRAAADATVADIDGPLEKGPAEQKLDSIRDAVNGATSLKEVDDADKEWVKHMAVYSDEVQAELNKLIANKRTAIRENG